MEELIKSLPPMAVFGVGLAIGIGWLVRSLGLAQGQAAAPTGTSSAAQVAAVIVDPSALNRASAAGEGVAAAIKDWTKASADQTHMVCRRIEAHTDAVEAQTVAINALTLEMVRRSGR
jgi:hypothetical protein